MIGVLSIRLYIQIMSFERFKFWRSSTDNPPKGEDSFINTASNMMNIYLKKPDPTIQEFEEYLSKIPKNYRKSSYSKPKGNNSNSLKPQYLKKCYESVDAKYFDAQFAIREDFFTRNKKVSREKQGKLHEDLDEVEVCLFNQITSRFDQILSVMRTIESLQCIVDDNRHKLRNIRQNNLALSKTVSRKQCHVLHTVTKKKKLEGTLALLKKIKIYQNFAVSQRQSIEISNHASYYGSIQQLKQQAELYRKLQCIPRIDEKVQQYQGALKKSFSDSLNDSIFRYITEIVPYEKTFWGRMQYKMDMFEEDKKDADGTVILDQSVLIQQQHVVVIILSPQKEQLILQNLKRGWTDGEYSVGGLKAKVDSFLREFHANFMQDYRHFCVQMCQRYNKTVQNPSLTNILNLMTVSFCVRIFQYFNDAHKNMLERLFSVVSRCVNFIISEGKNDNKTIDQKYILNNIIEGLANTQSFIFGKIADKMSDLLEMKKIEQTTDLFQFKSLIGVFDGEEQFIKKKLTPLATYEYDRQSFLAQKLEEVNKKLSLDIITRNKNQKLRSYLNQMHKFVVESQLKDNLQNEIWQPVDIPTFFYDSLHFLISGQSLNLRRNRYTRQNSSFNGSMMFESSVLMDSVPTDHVPIRQQSKSIIGNFRIIRNEITIEGKIYKVTQTVLLIIQILEDYLNLVQSYPVLRQQVACKIHQLLRSYNSSSCQLIIHGGAKVFGKIKTKNITAKHLALSSLCLSFILYLMDCILKRADIQDSKKLAQNIRSHMNETIETLHSILVKKVNSNLNDINLQNSPSKGTEVIVNSTKILHDILIDFYQKPTLREVFTKQSVRLYVDKIATLKVSNRLGAEALKDDITFYFNELRFLDDLIPEFSKLRVEAQDSVRRAFQSL